MVQIKFLALFIIAILKLTHGTNDEEAKELFEEYFRWTQRMNPEFASLAGFHDYDSKLSDYSLKGALNKELACKSFRNRALNLLDDGNLASEGVEQSLHRLVDEVSVCAEGMKFKGYLLAPVSFLENVQAELPRFFESRGFFKLEEVDDMENVIERLKAIPPTLDGVIEALKEGIKENITFARASLWEQKEQFERLRTENIETSPFYHPFKTDKFNCDNGTDTMDEYREEGKKIIAKQVLPAYEKLYDFLTEEYDHHLRPHVGVWALRNGQEFYQACIEYYTNLKNVTPEIIHEIGKDSIAELREKVLDLAQSIGLNGTFKEVVENVRTSPEFKFKTKNEVIDLYTKTLFDTINPRLERLFKLELLVKEIYDLDITESSQGPTVWYQDASYDDSRNATVFVRLTDMENVDKTTVTSLTLHEANPGHHFERTFQRRRDDAEMFEKFHFPENLNRAPSLLPDFNGFIEGWAFYAESLGHDLNVYEDPHQLMGHYTELILRSVRLVVDTGIHHFKWTREQAIDFMMENVAFSRTAVVAEIDRYITLPGQALAYKMGERIIRNIRRNKEKALGEAFDLRKFHFDILSCYGRLDKLQACFEAREKRRT